MRPYFVAVALVGLTACAGRMSPTSPAPLSEPRASWTIRAGDNGSEREVCSSGRDQACIISASSAQQTTSVIVSVHFYPAGEEQTNYRGAFLASFMGMKGQGHETKVDYSIKPGEQPRFISSIWTVTSIPGTYEFRMALLAEVTGHSDPHQFQELIPVRVVARSTGAAG